MRNKPDNLSPMSFDVPDDKFVKSGWCKKRGPCVSIARTEHGVAIRDTKDASKATQFYTHEEWDAFVNGVKAGEFDTKV